MAKYLLMAEKTFTSLLNRVGKGRLPVSGTREAIGKVKKGARVVNLRMSDLKEHFSNFRDDYRALYEKTTGNQVPKGKVVIPKDLHDRIKDFLSKKSSFEKRAAAMTELDRALVTASKKPGGRPPPQLGEKHARTFQNPGFMPTYKGSRRLPPKSEVNKAREIVQSEQRAWEELLALSGEKARLLTPEQRDLIDYDEGSRSRLPSLEELVRPTPYKQRYRLKG